MKCMLKWVVGKQMAMMMKLSHSEIKVACGEWISKAIDIQ